MWRIVRFCATTASVPKEVPAHELVSIIDAVVALDRAVSFDEIAERAELQLPRRTLQRRLATLVREGRLVALSARGGRRYRANLADAGVAEPPQSVAPVRAQIPFSAAASEVRRSVTRPMSSRRPVGYDTSFLEEYRPNESAYLPPAVRRKLSEMGQTDGHALPAGTYFRKVLDRVLIDLSWNSSRLEGNTYSLLETQRLLEAGETADGKAADEKQMILNHKAAIELLAEQADEIGFNRYTICNVHALLAENLLADPVAGGRLRTGAVAITGTVFHPLEVPQMIEDCFDLFLAKASAIEDAFEQAFFAMVHLPYLQPFDDVNKRVSRLAANIPLIRWNLSPLSFVDLPQSDYVQGIIGVYELNRVELLRDVFVWAYERSCARYSAVRQSMGQPDLFRLRYRQALLDVVNRVIRDRMDKKAAAAFVRQESGKLPNVADHARFATLAETELTSLHDGNFARFRVRPAEFAAWKQTWR
jgi:Fic family protein